MLCAEEHEECDPIDSLSSRVIDFKNDYFAVQQTVNEMIKSSGDLTALGLMNGLIVGQIYVFGLACNYDKRAARLVEMNINFCNNEAMVQATTDEVDMHKAVMWLLNNITNI